MFWQCLFGSAIVLSMAWSSQTKAAGLPGCASPRALVDALGAMDLPRADWAALTPAKIRSSWSGLLNQVECPDRPRGLYLLSSFGRIVNDEPLCAITFAIQYDAETKRHWLSKVTVYHTARTFSEARAAADLLYNVWHPAANVDAEEYGQDEWKRTATKPGRARTVSRWRTTMAACETALEIEREISPSSAWTVKVSLAPDSVCGTPSGAEDTSSGR